MDSTDRHVRSRARHLKEPPPGSRGEDWMLEAMRHLFDAVTADKRV